MTSESRKPSPVFVRDATGLVRDVGFFDIVVYNMLPIAPGLTLALYLFWIPGAFPGGSLVWAMLIACFLAIFIATTFGLMSMAMPRTASDYVAVSRVLHPAVGLASSLLLTLSSLVSCGLFAITWTTAMFTPAISVMGAITGNTGLVDFAGTVSLPLWSFLIGVVSIIVLCYVIALGMRRLMLFQNILFVVGMIGLVAMALILATTSREVFISRFNVFAEPFTNQTDTYDYYIKQAAATGMQYTGSYNLAATLPIVPAIMVFGMWTWWSVAFSGEIKGAASRRQWYSTLLAAVIQYAILIVMVLLIFNTMGEQFIASANYLYAAAPSTYAIPVTPMLPLLAGIIPGGYGIPLFIVLTFLAWQPLLHFIQFVQPIKAMFAWSFDRVFPAKISEVNERTHAPLIAIIITGVIGIVFLAWGVFGTGFYALATLVGLFGAGTMALMGLTAIVFPYTKRELYSASPAKIEFAGIPLCVIAGVVTIVGVFYVSYAYVTDPRLGLAPMASLALLLTFGTLAAGVVVYYVSRAFRRRQGIDLDMAFIQIPPE